MGSFEFDSTEQVRRSWINNDYEFDELAFELAQQSAPEDSTRARSVEYHASSLLGSILLGSRPFPEPTVEGDPLSGVRDRAEELADQSAELFRGQSNG